MDISGLVVSRGTFSGHLSLMSLLTDPACMWYKALLMFGLPPGSLGGMGMLRLPSVAGVSVGKHSTMCYTGWGGWGTLLLCCSSSPGKPFCSLHIFLFSFCCFLCYFYGSQLCLVGRNREKWIYIILSCHMFMYIFVYSYVFPILL